MVGNREYTQAVTPGGLIDYRGCTFGRPFFDVKLNKADFSYCELDGQLSQVEFCRCLFEKSKFSGTLHGTLLESVFTKVVFSNLSLLGEIVGCSFNDVKFRNVRGYDDTLVIEKCNFLNCYFHRSSLMGVKFVSCRFENCKYLGNTFADSQFIGCNVNESTFGDSILIDTTFTRG